MTSEDKDIRLPDSRPEQGHHVLHYNPNRVELNGGGLKLVETKLSSFVVTVLVVAGFTVVMLSLCWETLLPVFIYLLLLPVALLDLIRPTNVEVDCSGFRLHWISHVGLISGPPIKWADLTAVDYVIEDSGRNADASRFELVVQPDAEFEKAWWFHWLTSFMSRSLDNGRVCLRLFDSGFYHEADRAAFLSTLHNQVPAERMSASMLALQQFGDVPTYTTLWLDSLHSTRHGPETELAAGTRLADGRYEVVGQLGAGGQAVVYDAVERAAEASAVANGDANASAHASADGAHRCVLKEFVLPIRGGAEVKKHAVMNIQREANLLKALDHSSIVKFKDLFIDGPRAYLVMEKIEGVSLRQLVDRHGPLSSTRVKELALQICALLEYLHSQDPPVVHRDCTPENLMVADDGIVKMIDFNVAHRLESDATKTVVGKHAYVPPEQFRGRPTTQSDIYALGATLYFLLTGEDPEAISSSNPALVNRSVDSGLAKVIAKATEPDLSARYANIAELRNDLSCCGDLR